MKKITKLLLPIFIIGLVGASLASCTEMKTDLVTTQNASPNNSSSSRGATFNIF